MARRYGKLPEYVVCAHVAVAMVYANSPFLSMSYPSKQQIEPVVGNGPSTEPVLLTGGLEYVPYGELYLDILSAATTRGNDNIFDYFFNGGR
jgi:hypothetical protein